MTKSMERLEVAPFAALIGDYEFGRTSLDVHLLEQLTAIAAAVHAPFISAASPDLFSLDNFSQLTTPRDLFKSFDNETFAAWNQFRRTPQAAFAGLVLPHVLSRLPYGRANQAVAEFDYEENVNGSDSSKYLWGTAVYAIAARLAAAFSRHGWAAAITGPERGGSVFGLPVHRFQTQEGDLVIKCPTEIPISDSRRHELEQLGFIPLCWRKGTGEATFFHAGSVAKPSSYLDDLTSRAAMAQTQLEYVFAASRFAQYIRCSVRDKLWTFTTPAEWEAYLNHWLAGYVLLEESTSDEVKARFPLRAGRLSLREAPGYPLRYICDLTIQPQFQMKDAGVPLDISVPISLDLR